VASASVERVLTHLWALDCDPRGNDERGYSAKCPAHNDRNPSLSIGQGHDGRALVFCHRGCALEEIAAALTLNMTELFEPDDKPADPAPKVVSERYDYVDEHGQLLFQVERLVPKGFRQRRPDGRGGWEYRLGDVRRVLYRLPQVIAAVKAGKKICVVEGERDVHTLEAKGQVATTCPGGAGKWRPEYSEVLRGGLVAIIQDVDVADPKTGHRPGQEHAAAVRDALTGVAEKVKVLQPAVGNDVTDHVKAGLPLGALIDATEPRPPQGLQVLSAREMMALPDPDTSGYLLGPLLYRGHRIVVGGWTGHGKTTFTMHMISAACYGRQFLNWKGKGGLRALVVDVEQGQRTVKRILRETRLEEADRVSYLRIPDGLALDTDEDAIASMERIFAAGVGGERYDIVLADPLYKLSRGNPNDARAATDLMRRFDDWRERYGFALILPMHCRKPQPDSQLSPHDLFGSSAYQWGAEMLLGIQRKSKSLSWLHFWKDREGEVAEDGGTVGQHWDILFDRDRGFTHHDKGKQGQLVEVAQTPRFDLARFIYEEIRNTGPVSRKNIKDKAWTKFHLHYNDGMLDRALDRVGGYGVISNGAPRKADRIYFLQDELLPPTDNEPRPETEAQPLPDAPEEVMQP
jgi:hypothetical protein